MDILFGDTVYFIEEFFGNWLLPKLLETVLFLKGLGAFKFIVGIRLPFISWISELSGLL